jgi:methionyl-tRNA synthetase
VGERVMFDGYAGDPDEQLNPKKKVFEAVAPDLTTNQDCVATYKGLPFMTSAGPCRVASVKGGGIK